MKAETADRAANLAGLVWIALSPETSAFEKQCARQNLACFTPEERTAAFAAAEKKHEEEAE